MLRRVLRLCDVLSDLFSFSRCSARIAIYLKPYCFRCFVRHLTRLDVIVRAQWAVHFCSCFCSAQPHASATQNTIITISLLFSLVVYFCVLARRRVCVRCYRQFGIIVDINKGMCQRTRALVCKLGVSIRMYFYLSSKFASSEFLFAWLASSELLPMPSIFVGSLGTIKYRTHSLHTVWMFPSLSKCVYGCTFAVPFGRLSVPIMVVAIIWVRVLAQANNISNKWTETNVESLMGATEKRTTSSGALYDVPIY